MGGWGRYNGNLMGGGGGGEFITVYMEGKMIFLTPFSVV